MFAEELAGNASRKRAEENRARRRRLKAQQQQQQQQKQQQQQQTPTTVVVSSSDQDAAVTATTTTTSTTTTTASVDDSTTSTMGTAGVNSNEGDTNITTTTTTDNKNNKNKNLAISSTTTTTISTNNKQGGISSSNNNNKALLSAVDRAAEQRMIRAREAIEKSSSIIIQSIWRTYRTRTMIYRDYIQGTLTKRLQDLSTIKTMIEQNHHQQKQQQQSQQQESQQKQQQKTTSRPAVSSACYNYVPPPATTTMMVRQLLFLTHQRTLGSWRRRKTKSRKKAPSVSSSSSLSNEENKSLGETRTTRTPICLTSTEQAKLLQQILDYCLLPGITHRSQHTEDANGGRTLDMHPLLPWMETSVGRYRLENLLRLVLVSCTTSTISASSQQQQQKQLDRSCIDFITQLLQQLDDDCHSNSGHRDRRLPAPTTTIDDERRLLRNLTNHVRSLLLVGSDPSSSSSSSLSDVLFIPSSSSSSSLETSQLRNDNNNNNVIKNNHNFPPYAMRNTSLDIIGILRYQLLYGMSSSSYGGGGGSNYSASSSSSMPIPKDAQDKRDTCIPIQAKERVSHLLKLIMDVIFFSSSMSSTTLTTTTEQNNNNNKNKIDHHLRALVAQKILTIPLLTWKITSSSISSLVTPTTTSAATISTTTTTSSSNLDNYIIPFIELLRSMIHVAAQRNDDSDTIFDINNLLPSIDVPLTRCPATPSQCLLANLSQLGRLCPSIIVVSEGSSLPVTGTTNHQHHPSSSSSSSSSFDPMAATIYWNVIAALYDAVPVATLSSRESAVTWVTVNYDNNHGYNNYFDDGHGNSNNDNKNGGGSNSSSHYVPIVLSPVILEHCQSLLVDAVIRRCFNMSIACIGYPNEDIISNTLCTKNDIDIRNEKEFMNQVGTSSASTIAAKEAKMDRNKSFWATNSKWAKQLTKGVANLLSSATTTTTTSSGGSAKNNNNNDDDGGKRRGGVGVGTMKNTSSISRSLALTGSTTTTTDDSIESSTTTTTTVNAIYCPELFFALCRTLAIVLARWGGNGLEDIIVIGSTSSSGKRKNKSSNNNNNNKVGGEGQQGDVTADTVMATSKPETVTMALLNTLCFSTSIVRAAWCVIQLNDDIIKDVRNIVDNESSSSNGTITTVRALSVQPTFQNSNNNNRKKTNLDDDGGRYLYNNNDGTAGAAILYLFVCVFSHILIITDDVEIHDMEKPLPMHHIRRCIDLLKKLLYRACYLDDSSPLSTSNYLGLALITVSARTLRDLYNRSSRRPYCTPKFWIISDLLEREIRKCRTYEQYIELLASMPVLRVCPYLVSFKRRLKLFERIITTNRISIQGVNDPNPFNSNPLKPGIPIRITRGRILEDGLLTMNRLGRNALRQRIAVQYVNEGGAAEAGIDAGGLFKEFWTDLSGVAFNLNYALFKVTDDNSGKCLYPNPSSGIVHGSGGGGGGGGSTDHVILFEFLGRILGKALYEGITIHPRFAHFFLGFLKGNYNYLNMLHDLSTIDQQLYNNLMFLKTYNGDATDLCLTFTVTNDDFGNTREVPLIYGGSDIEVTNTNKHRYISSVAKYYVVDRVKIQSEAFTRGLWDVIDRSWLQIFNEPELQVLISGSYDDELDIDDMKSNTRYTGGYTGIEPTIYRFWNIIRNMSTKQHRSLLRFVTSCERPPSLGFSSMNPPFTIQRITILRDGDKLPTSSTCFNILKLPTYSNEKIMKQRLLYAIESGAGFELT